MSPNLGSDPVRVLAARGHHYVWRRIGGWFAEVGSIAMFIGDTFRALPRGLRAPRLLVDEILDDVRRFVTDGATIASAR